MNILEDITPGGGGSGGWYHCSVKTVSRGAGRSAVAAAAYRLGMELYDEKSGVTHNYTRRSGVVTTFLLAPPDAPEWAFDPERFWNRAEAVEKRKDARVAREIELALPNVLTDSERKEIVSRAARFLCERYKVGVSAAIHEPGKGDDRNHHAHLLFSTRSLGPDGFGAKTRILDDKTSGAQEITAIRKHMAFLINDALEQGGHEERVDYRSFSARGIARKGTKHLGPAAHQIEKRGKPSHKGDRNREIETGNGQLGQIVADLSALEAELKQVQEALLDERFGPSEDERSADTPALALLEADHAPDATAGKPEWWLELQEPPPSLSAPQVEALMNTAATPYLAQIAEHGSLQDGEPEGLRWHDRIAIKGAELWQHARDWARGTWQSLVADRREQDETPGRGPDMER